MLRLIFFTLGPMIRKGVTHKKPTIIAPRIALTRKRFHSFYKLGIPTLTSIA
jgi:hypothetical protein